MNGGYILIDCTGLDLTKGLTEQTITGLYKKVADCMQKNKPLYCVNAVLGDSKTTPIGCFANKSSTDDIIITSSTLQITVKSSDVVTINNLVS